MCPMKICAPIYERQGVDVFFTAGQQTPKTNTVDKLTNTL
jgi:hypothetical protein